MPIPTPTAVSTCFNLQASYTENPVELLELWSESIIPEMIESEDGRASSAPLLSKRVAPAFIRVLFVLLEAEFKRLDIPEGARLPELKKRDKGSTQRKDKHGDDVVVLTDDEARRLMQQVERLLKPFVQLVLATRYLEAATGMVAVAVKHAAVIMKQFNNRVIPFLSAYFRPLYKDVIDLLKHLQPSTRLLQAHCSQIKEKMLIAALKPVAALKKELEGLLFKVRHMLLSHNCTESFWMGCAARRRF